MCPSCQELTLVLWGRRASTESLNLNDAADRGLYTSPLGCCAGSQRRKCPERSLVSSQGDTQPAGALPWNSPAGLRHLPSNERDDPSIRLCSPESSSPGLLTRQVSSLRGPSLQMSTGLSRACQRTMRPDDSAGNPLKGGGGRGKGPSQGGPASGWDCSACLYVLPT